MGTRRERRHVARLTIPPQFSDRELEQHQVRLLELSPEGARIEHSAPLNTGLMCFIDLPRALGRGSLSGRIMWTRLHRDEQTLEGKQHRYYQSGLGWTGLTPEQQGALAAALDILQAAQEPRPSK